MAPEPDRPPVINMLCECLIHVARNCTLPIEPDAIDFWHKHYLDLFQKAYDSGAPWESLRQGVMKRAALLGARAQIMAVAADTTIDAAVAEAASAENDCTARKYRPLDVWCGSGGAKAKKSVHKPAARRQGRR